MNGKAHLPEKGTNNRFLVIGRAGMDLAAAEPGRSLEQGGQFVSDLGGSSANIAVGIARLGGKAASTRRRARTWSAAFTSRAWCWLTPTCSRPCRGASC